MDSFPKISYQVKSGQLPKNISRQHIWKQLWTVFQKYSDCLPKKALILTDVRVKNQCYKYFINIYKGKQGFPQLFSLTHRFSESNFGFVFASFALFIFRGLTQPPNPRGGKPPFLFIFVLNFDFLDLSGISTDSDKCIVYTICQAPQTSKWLFSCCRIWAII